MDELLDYASAHPWLFLCLVDDGSSDRTFDTLSALAKRLPDRSIVVRLATNRGKAEAVRTGILAGLDAFRPAYVGYMDADLATPLTEIERLIHIAEDTPSAVMFSGCRLKRLGVEVNRKWWRHYLGRLFATAAALVLSLPVYDTQCGAKLFRPETARSVFSERFLSRWAFDVEIFARIALMLDKDEARRRILEIPLMAWHDRGGSKLSLRHYFTAAAALCRIYLSYRLK
jgi:glycosyltransferase involved in cell wall biosynthesis